MNIAKQNTKDKEKTVEQMGIFFEQGGLTPIHGRVFAYLLLAEPAYKDFYEIQAFLKASKSAISNAIKFLMSKNMIKYITFSGDRRRYFQVDIDGWLIQSKQKVKEVNTMNQLLKNVLDSRTNSEDLAFNAELQHMLDFHSQLTDTLNQFLKNWERNKE